MDDEQLGLGEVVEAVSLPVDARKVEVGGLGPDLKVWSPGGSAAAAPPKR